LFILPLGEDFKRLSILTLIGKIKNPFYGTDNEAKYARAFVLREPFQSGLLFSFKGAVFW
jgi:hypothetical protein